MFVKFENLIVCCLFAARTLLFFLTMKINLVSLEFVGRTFDEDVRPSPIIRSFYLGTRWKGEELERSRMNEGTLANEN